MHGSTRYLMLVVFTVLFLPLLYRWSLILPQIRVPFSVFFSALPTLLGVLFGFKLLREKEASTRSTILCISSLALALPFLTSLMLYSAGYPNLLGSIYTPQLAMIIVIVTSCLAIMFIRPIRDFLAGLASSTGGRYLRSVGDSRGSANGGYNVMFLASRLGFGRFVVLGGVSVLGIPRGFPSPGSKLTQDVEGILSSKEDLGSYSTGFLTALSKLREHLVFEIQVSRKRVSLYFYVLIISRNLREAVRRASSATQGIRGAITGAYGKNVNANTLSRAELTSALNAILGGEQTTHHIGLLKENDGYEVHQFYDVNGMVVKVTAVGDDEYHGSSEVDVRYLSVLRLRDGFPALKASGGENQMSTLISSLLDLDARNVSFIVSFRPTKPSLFKKMRTKGAANTLRENRSQLRDMQSFKEILEEERSLKELNEVRYGESSGYWKVSAHLIVDSKTALGAIRSLEGAKASITSIFSDPHFSVELERLRGRSLLGAIRGFPLRRLMSGRSLEMSSVRLSALIHMPTQPYPGIDRRDLPEFEVPRSLEESDSGKLVLGKVLSGDRELYPVGIDLKDLTLNMVVVGHIGSGKTMFVSQLVLNLWEANPSLGWLVFDVKGEYTPIRRVLPERVMVYRPGDELKPLRLNIFDCGVDDPENHALKLFAILRDTLSSLFEDSAELSPQMERLCREALMKAVADPTRWNFRGFYLCLEDQAKLMQPHTPTIMSSLEAIKNRVEKFRHGVLRNVFDVNTTNLDFNTITSEKIIIDLSYLLSHGGTKDDVRLLMNVMLKNMFDRAMKLGLSRTIRHIVVVEEAGLLVPEVFSRKTSSETTPAEDIVLVERALGEGMILVSPRPTISENILANSGTKVIFRCPYDSERVSRFLNLNKAQERYLKVLPKREAIVTIPNYPYPFRIKTLDSELSKSSSPEQAEFSRTAGPYDRESDDFTDDDFDFDQDDDIGDLPITYIVERGEDDLHEPIPVHARNIDTVGREVLNRLLKKGLDSDRFRVFKAIAGRSPMPVKALIIVEEVLSGEWWRLLDAYRSLQDTRVWSEPLIRAVGNEPADLSENEDVDLELTEYGESVWKAISIGTVGEPRRLDRLNR